ncbi:AGAP000175-PA-like protein [Anopheles sinensis]|uniref:AGAP000175-PA-like protein n=1 Tax=Anopheles sinensis TaxID=74873 RepID=A0A084WPU9_ANOSI|nr:AGAP000175-PA-like protein [Anopheles sinensis]
MPSYHPGGGVGHKPKQLTAGSSGPSQQAQPPIASLAASQQHQQQQQLQQQPQSGNPRPLETRNSYAVLSQAMSQAVHHEFGMYPPREGLPRSPAPPSPVGLLFLFPFLFHRTLTHCGGDRLSTSYRTGNIQ